MCTCLLYVLIGQSCLAEKQFEKGLGTDYVRVRKSPNSQDMLAVLREEQEGSIIAGGLIWNKYVLAAQATKQTTHNFDVFFFGSEGATSILARVHRKLSVLPAVHPRPGRHFL